MITAVVVAAAIAAAPPTDKAGTDKLVKAVRAEYQSVGGAMKDGSLRTAKVSFGGGQNPTDYEIGYLGVSESEAIKNPYASPFHLRRVTQHKVLPAVGDAAVEYTFSKDGKLLFAYCTGVDIAGAPQLNDRPGSQTRVYFADDETVARVVATTDDGDKTIDAAGATAKDKQTLFDVGKALVKHAHVIERAFETLGD